MVEPAESLPPPQGEVIGAGRRAEVLVWGPGLVLKLFRPDAPEHAAEVELTAAAAAVAAGVAAAAPHGLAVHDGRRGVVLDRIDGHDSMARLSARPWQLAGIARVMGALQARLHAIEAPATLPGLVERLERDLDAADLDELVRTAALVRLASLPKGDRLLHGDLHPGNMLLTATGPVLIDWTDASAGPPAADAARTELLLTAGEIPRGAMLPALLDHARLAFAKRWKQTYLAASGIDPAELEAWRPIVAAARLAETVERGEACQLRAIASELL